MFDRFAIARGYYWFLTNYHEGQGSRKYARLCRLSRWYRPGCFETGPSDEDGSQAVYDALEARELAR